jgi:hypothetical protein
MRSGTLNGEAVVVFVRALCAVSQEELAPSSSEEPARWEESEETLARTRFALF